MYRYWTGDGQDVKQETKKRWTGGEQEIDVRWAAGAEEIDRTQYVDRSTKGGQ